MFVVSADFVSSGFIWNVELRHARERHHEGTAIVIRDRASGRLWTSTMLGQLQTMPSGVGRRSRSGRTRDEARAGGVAAPRGRRPAESADVPNDILRRWPSARGTGGLTTRARRIASVTLMPTAFEQHTARLRSIERGEVEYGEGSARDQALRFYIDQMLDEAVARALTGAIGNLPGPSGC